MPYIEAKPSQHLAGIVDRYFILSTERNNTQQHSDLIVPDNTPGLLIVLDEHLGRTGRDASQINTLKSIYLFGQKTTPVRYHFPESGMKSIGIKFTPTGLSHLTNMPLTELQNSFTSASDILPINFNSLTDKLACLSTTDRLFSTLDSFLTDNLSRGENPDLTWTESVLKHFRSSMGGMPITDLAKKFHSYPKMLERRFLQYVGLTPKMYARILRFNYSIGLRLRHREENYSEIAQRAGYFDQMHYIRDFKTFTGKTPRQFFSAQGMVSIELSNSFLTHA